MVGLFVVEDKGAHDLKGVAAPVPLYRVVRASWRQPAGRGARADAASRPRGRASAADAPLVARTRRRRSVSFKIVGEPGIGKSRLDRGSFAQNSERRRTPQSNVGCFAAPAEHAPASHRRVGQTRAMAVPTATDEGRLADLENTLYVWLASTRTE